MAEKTKPLQTYDFLLWILIFVPLFFLPSSKDVFNFPKVVLLTSLVVGLLLHFILGGPRETRDKTFESKTVFTSLITLSLCLIASSFFTETSLIRSVFGYPGRANGIITYASLIILLWIGSRLSIEEEFKTKLKRYLMFLILVFLAYSAIQFLGLDPIKWNNPYNKIIGTLGNPNFSGAFLGISGVVLFQFFLLARTRSRFVFLALTLFSVFLGYSTESFQSVLIFGIGISTLLIFHYRYMLSTRIFGLIIFLFSLMGIFALLSFLGFGPLGTRLFQPTLRLRLEYWNVGLETSRAFPFFGIGPDSYAEGWRLFRSPDFVKTYSEGVSVDSAHNVLINFMANFGVPAFICLSIIYFFIAKSAIKVMLNPSQEKPIVKVVALMWILLFIQSLFSLEQIGLNTLQWTLGALLLNPEFRGFPTVTLKQDSRRNSFGRSKGFFVRSELAMISVVLSFTGFLPVLLQEIRLNQIMGISVEKSTPQELIDQELGKFGVYSKLEMGRAIVLSDFLLRAERYREAELLIEEITAGESRSYEATEQLARLAGFKKDFEEEIRLRKRIEEFDPQNYKNLVSLAEALRIQGQVTLSKLYAQKVLDISNDSQVNKIAIEILEESK